MKISGKDIKPEYELLLLCARGVLETPRQERVRAITGTCELDWEFLVDFAVRNRILPLAAKNLLHYSAEDIPAGIRTRFRALYRNNEAYNRYLSGHLLLILHLFELHNIQAVPFKGPVLAVSAFGDSALRTFGDLDLLLPGPDLEKAVRILFRHGYSTPYDLSVPECLYLARQTHHVHLHNQQTNVTVELHWEMTGRYLDYSLEFDEVVAVQETIRLLGDTVSNIGPEYLLVYLCVHGNRHLWLQLDFVCGIAEHIRSRPDLDWDRAIDLADRLGAGRMLLLGLMLAEELLQAPIPEHVRNRFHKDPRLLHAKRESESFLLGPRFSAEETGQLKALSFHVRTFDHLSTGIVYCFRKIFRVDAVDMAWIRLPTYVRFLYILIRPLRLSLNSIAGLHGATKKRAY